MKRSFFSILLMFVMIAITPISAYPRVCTTPIAVGPGMFWIWTNGNKTVSFKYYGNVTRIQLWGGQNGQTLLYEGNPIPSWNAAGKLGLSASGSGTIEITTDWKSPSTECK